jgi:phage shock protein PspC (stress-responsive transcriptional regulator)
LSPPAAVVAAVARPVARDDCRPLILSLRENFREGSLGKKNLLAFANAFKFAGVCQGVGDKFASLVGCKVLWMVAHADGAEQDLISVVCVYAFFFFRAPLGGN